MFAAWVPSQAFRVSSKPVTRLTSPSCYKLRPSPRHVTLGRRRISPLCTLQPPTPPSSATGDTRGLNGAAPFYLALVAAQAIPFLLPNSGIAGDVIYFTVTALACIVIGSGRAPFEEVLSEPISKIQAIAAPFAASTFLFGSYLLLKYTSVNVSVIFNAVTTFGGTLCLKEALDPVFHAALSVAGLQDLTIWKGANGSEVTKDGAKEKNGTEGSSEEEVGEQNAGPVVQLPAVASSIAAIGITGAYLMKLAPTYLFSNMIAVGICTRVLALVRPSSFVVAAGLLTGLFFYDIFWVFGSEVMFSVATQIDSPGKLLFPRAAIEAGVDKYPYAILGLGDVCIPGLFVNLARCMDDRLGGKKGRPYFTAAVTAYVVGLGTCFAINMKTHAAQPALLYLVPALILSALGVGGLRGQLGDVVGFQLDEKLDNS